ncbi:hypothetical conserved protein [Rhizobium etli CIAT 652]|uniref:Hypothetical conserved protein n=1 Tax=Rhizobium etli (strain CIAT 652) TaxID=491916 RepID=B3Q0H1_RHIE6|nr:hypothetical conserved protein [Rhizobium etli CIAT 652]
MKGGNHDERHDGQRDDVGHGNRVAVWGRLGRPGDRGARQIPVLSLKPARGMDRRSTPRASKGWRTAPRLAFGAVRRNPSIAMRHLTARKLVALFLAVFVAVGMSLSVVQASSMAAQMAAMSGMEMEHHGGCPDCPGKAGDDGMKAMACSSVCATPILATLPAAVHMPAVRTLASFVARDPSLHGTALRPDPYPPRTSDIG